MMSKNLAQQALKTAMANKGGRVGHTLPTGFLEPFVLFRNALNDEFPETSFTAPDVMRWAGEYDRIANKSGKVPIPEVFYNPYALGKVLKSHQEGLGIQFVGTYGNRAVYAILQEEDNG